MKRIIILDFQTGIVYVRKIPKSLLNEEAEDVMDYFENELKIHSNDCNYMITTLPKYLNDNTNKI